VVFVDAEAASSMINYPDQKMDVKTLMALSEFARHGTF
jgi:hypothetical protein